MQGKRSEWRPPRHIRERWRTRDKRLRKLGFATYDAYLKSAHWRTVKARYRASDLPQRCECGKECVEFHHKTYERVGVEELTDLEPLCRNCHRIIHVLDRRGEISLDLHDLASDERAARYADDEFNRTRAERALADEERKRAERRERRKANAPVYAAKRDPRPPKPPVPPPVPLSLTEMTVWELLAKMDRSGVRIDDPDLPTGHVEQLLRDDLIYQRRSRTGQVRWRATDAGRSVLTNPPVPS